MNLEEHEISEEPRVPSQGEVTNWIPEVKIQPVDFFLFFKSRGFMRYISEPLSSHLESRDNKACPCRMVVVELLNHVQLFTTLWTVAHQAPLSMGFSRQEYWSGLPFPSPGDLPDPGIEPRSPALQTDSLLTEL